MYFCGTAAINMICHMHGVGSIAHGNAQIHTGYFEQDTLLSTQPVIDTSCLCSEYLIMSRDSGLDTTGTATELCYQLSTFVCEIRIDEI